MSNALIIDVVRTPIGRFGGGLLEHSATDLATIVLKALIERNSIPGEAVEEVILGQVLQGGSGINVGRTAAMKAGLPVSVYGSTINNACASGMKAMDMARQGILLGEGDVYLAGGAESMSNVPYYVREMRWGHKLFNTEMVDGVMDGLTCPVTGMGMGLTAEEIASRTGITREEMDAWALRSQERAAAAIAAGRFADEIVPVPLEGPNARSHRASGPGPDTGGTAAGMRPLLTTDEHPRETSLEALAGLKPAFKPDGCITAGNASGINDGAAACLIASPEAAERHGWTARAAILGSALAGVEPEVMGLGPIDAVRKLCDKLDLSVDDFELVELNEAFAVQAVAVIRELGLDEERVNVNGSGIALGHPIGATGARIVCSLLYEMERRDLHLGLATLCQGGGMGMAMAIERQG
ncbi:MAG: thiolase family protein [Armatimonadetes bacterium]|nr:thiolase family protein [Armatimonadota bacterium]